MMKDLIATIDSYARTDPEKIAYHLADEQYTYAELKQRSDALAAYFDQLDLSAGQPIMVFGGKQIEMIVSFLAAVKSGHPYIPVDVNSPEDRLTMIAKIAQPGVVVAVSPLPVALGIKTITLADLTQITATPVAYEVTHSVQDDATFYIIFTSGTTGVPKGVTISANNLTSFVRWMLGPDFALPTDLQMLQQPAFSFDLSVMSLYPTLYSGGTLHVLDKEMTDNFPVLFNLLPTLPMNTWVSTPSFIDICLMDPTFNASHFSLTRFLFCGEELTHKTAATLKQRFPQARIFNTYGPTEATVAMTQIEITDDILATNDRLPIGRVKPGMEARIVDEAGDAVPTGKNGELIIYGNSVAKGYLNNPERTMKAFFTFEGRQAYRTGDVASLDDDGVLHYLGRSDFQIKLNGFRIELEDVSLLVSQEDHVKQAVVVPKYNAQHKVAMLIAYVVPNEAPVENRLALTTAIKKGLAATMMAYMIPQRFVYKERLPLSSNGKIDVKTVMAEVNA